MIGRLIQTAKSAYQYPLIFKQLWHTPRVQAQGQEIVYRDLKRFTYLEIKGRIGRLASALSKAGVAPGDTVGVLEWDSHRFFEAFFAIPMMGAVLQTVNVRLSPEQITYTINHAGASVLLASDEFTGLLEDIKSKLPKVKTLVVMTDRPSPQMGSLSVLGEYEQLLAAAAPDRAHARRRPLGITASGNFQASLEPVIKTLPIPRQWKVIQTVREKFSCRECERITRNPGEPFHVGQGPGSSALSQRGLLNGGDVDLHQQFGACKSLDLEGGKGRRGGLETL
jgi:hypothetical protein